MKKKYKKLWITLAIVIGVIAVWKVAFTKKVQPLILPTERPVYGNIAQNVTATGRIQPLDTVTVGTQVSGVISVLNADFNSIVHKGQLLAQLDKSLLQATVDQGNAALATQKARWIIIKVTLSARSFCIPQGRLARPTTKLLKTTTTPL